MSKQSDVHTFPLCGWDIGLHKAHGVILFQPHFLASPFDSPDKPQKAQMLVIQPNMARELAEKLTALAEQLESSPSPVPEDMKN